MGELLLFGRPDPANLDREQVLACLESVRTAIAQLDEEEPEDMESEAYDQWGDRHEELEDWLDELMDRLDELDG